MTCGFLTSSGKGGKGGGLVSGGIEEVEVAQAKPGAWFLCCRVSRS